MYFPVIIEKRVRVTYRLIYWRITFLLLGADMCDLFLHMDNWYWFDRDPIVVHWPPTRPSCQNRKCTCVNNRCIRSRNIRIWPWLSRGWTECEIVTLAGRRVDFKLLYKPGNSWREDAGMRNMFHRGWAPRPPVEQPRRTGKKRCYGHKSGAQYVAVLFSLQLTSHTVKP